MLIKGADEMIVPAEFAHFESGLAASRRKLLSALRDSENITFFYGPGNYGDFLIWEGVYQLLSQVKYNIASREHIAHMHGDTAVFTGGGGWCAAFHSCPQYLPMLEANFKRVIIFPSSFDTSVAEVARTLSQSKALVFAREWTSYQLIKDLCNADYAYDTAFFFDYEPYKKDGAGTLHAYRNDPEKKGYAIPASNNDISATCVSLQDWLGVIASHDVIYTDRAHVTVASAMLGKQVYYRPSNYHKVRGIVEFSLNGFPVAMKENWE
jgi:exopolysaccharide biosynthesis predicted pyruvyltransferase EpsI